MAQGPRAVPWMHDVSFLMIAGGPVAHPSRRPGARNLAKLW